MIVRTSFFWFQVTHPLLDQIGRVEGFCMACILRTVAIRAHKNQGAFSPSLITNNLQSVFYIFLALPLVSLPIFLAIAKHLRKGRQEDTHEFLRYAIDALQKSCLAGYPPFVSLFLVRFLGIHLIFSQENGYQTSRDYLGAQIVRRKIAVSGDMPRLWS